MSDYIVGYSQRRGRVIFDRGSVCVEIEIDQTKKHRILAVLRKAMNAVAQAERVVDDMTDVEVHAYVWSHGSVSKPEFPVSDTPKYCTDPDHCTFGDCPSAFCDRDKKAFPVSDTQSTDEDKRVDIVLNPEFEHAQFVSIAELRSCEEKLNQINVIISRASNAFYADGTDQQVSLRMLSILNESKAILLNKQNDASTKN